MLMETTTIQLTKSTQEKLKSVGTMADTYDTLIRRLIEEHERMKRIDILVETQHEIAKKGKFVELD